MAIVNQRYTTNQAASIRRQRTTGQFNSINLPVTPSNVDRRQRVKITGGTGGTFSQPVEQNVNIIALQISSGTVLALNGGVFNIE